MFVCVVDAQDKWKTASKHKSLAMDQRKQRMANLAHNTQSMGQLHEKNRTCTSSYQVTLKRMLPVDCHIKLITIDAMYGKFRCDWHSYDVLSFVE